MGGKGGQEGVKDISNSEMTWQLSRSFREMAEQCPLRLLGVWFDTVHRTKHRQRTGLVTQACESSTWEYEKEGFCEFKAGQSCRLGSRSVWARERSANKEKYRSGR